MRAELLVLMFQHNRRANRVTEGVEFIRGGIGKDFPTEPERVEVRERLAIVSKDEWKAEGTPIHGRSAHDRPGAMDGVDR